MRISTTHHGCIAIEVDGIIEPPAVFDIEGEQYPTETGQTTEASAELVRVEIGGLTLSRHQVADAIGEDELQRQEAIAAAVWLDVHREGIAA